MWIKPKEPSKPMTDTAQKKMIRALKGETQDIPPIWLMRQAGRYLDEYRATRKQARNFLEFCHTPDLAVEVTLQPLRRYAFDAAILFSDILVIPDALGQKVEFKEGEGPVLEPIRTAEGLAALSMDGLHERMAKIHETVGRLSKEIPETTTLIGFAGAPWTVATYMVEGRGSKDYATIRALAYADPELFQRMIDLLVESTGQYLIRQIENGAEVVQLFDSWAGILAETEFMKWVVEPNARLVEMVKAAHPEVPVIGFPRGAGVMYETFVKQTKVDGVSLDPTVPLAWAAEKLQPNCTVQGNLDNLLLVAGGEAMDAEIDRILDILGSGPFIFNLGHGIVPHTPPEHVARLIDRIRNR